MQHQYVAFPTAEPGPGGTEAGRSRPGLREARKPEEEPTASPGKKSAAEVLTESELLEPLEPKHH